jgi:hypothetical protein
LHFLLTPHAMNEANFIFAILAVAFALRFAWLELSSR